MRIDELFGDNAIRGKAKAIEVGAALLEGRLESEELLAFAAQQSGANKATCIEGMEAATRQRPDVADENLFDFVTRSLDDDEPRVKWESAKVIANVARRFPDRLGPPVEGLLRNSGHDGTVVRWATAAALGEILLLGTSLTQELRPTIERLCDQEEDSGVKKKYLRALERGASPGPD